MDNGFPPDGDDSVEAWADRILAALLDGWRPIETAPKDGTYVMIAGSAGDTR